jgi:hypothetical protein
MLSELRVEPQWSSLVSVSLSVSEFPSESGFSDPSVQAGAALVVLLLELEALVEKVV